MNSLTPGPMDKQLYYDIFKSLLVGVQLMAYITEGKGGSLTEEDLEIIKENAAVVFRYYKTQIENNSQFWDDLYTINST